MLAISASSWDMREQCKKHNPTYMKTTSRKERLVKKPAFIISCFKVYHKYKKVYLRKPHWKLGLYKKSKIDDPPNFWPKSKIRKLIQIWSKLDKFWKKIRLIQALTRYLTKWFFPHSASLFCLAFSSYDTILFFIRRLKCTSSGKSLFLFRLSFSLSPFLGVCKNFNYRNF